MPADALRFRAMRFRLLAVASLALASLAATLMATASSAGAITRSQLQSKALSISNLPAGWSVHNSSTSSASVAACPGVIRHVVPAHDIKAKVGYADGRFHVLYEDLVAGSDTASVFAKIERDLALCKRFTETKDGQTITLTVRQMSFPAVGNESAAYSDSLSYRGINVGADVILFRVGDILCALTYAHIGSPDITSVHAYVTKALEKIEGQATVTPGQGQ
jgi:hypothetical protein